MSEHESSYYEIALTHRQVVVSFVVLLVVVLAAFLFGVWVGQSDDDDSATVRTATTNGDEGPDVPRNLGEVEEFRFPDGSQDESTGDEDLDKPDLSELGVDGSRPETTLAQDLGREPPPTRRAPDTADPPPPSGGESTAADTSDENADENANAAADTPRRPALTSDDGPFEPSSVTPAPAPSSAAAGDAGGFVVQVFSGRDEDQAKKVVETLEADGYDVFLSPVRVGQQMRYRVRIGPYAERSAAESAERVVKRKYRYETWVTAAGN